MKVYQVEYEGVIDFRKVKAKWWNLYKRFFDRLYIANKPGAIFVHTDEGVFRFSWKAGFECDGRSGGVFVDPIFPNWGDDCEKVPIICHDISFYEFCVSFKMGNELLKALMEFFDTAQWRCNLVFKGVSTKIARKAYGCKTKKEKANKALCGLEWGAK